MRKLNVIAALVIMAAFAVAGCGGAKPSAAETAPLTVASWKDLPASEKYSPETLERLMSGNPELNTPEGWERFQKTDLATARRKDAARKSKH